MIDIQITSATATPGIKEAVNTLFDTNLRDFPACCHSLFIDGFSATAQELDSPLWAFLDGLDTSDQGILLVYLLDAIRMD